MKLQHPDGRWVQVTPFREQSSIPGSTVVSSTPTPDGAPPVRLTHNMPIWMSDHLVGALLARGWRSDPEQAGDASDAPPAEAVRIRGLATELVDGILDGGADQRASYIKFVEGALFSREVQEGRPDPADALADAAEELLVRSRRLLPVGGVQDKWNRDLYAGAARVVFSRARDLGWDGDGRALRDRVLAEVDRRNADAVTSDLGVRLQEKGAKLDVLDRVVDFLEAGADEPAAFIVAVGPGGSGKTTLLRQVAEAAGALQVQRTDEAPVEVAPGVHTASYTWTKRTPPAPTRPASAPAEPVDWQSFTMADVKDRLWTDQDVHDGLPLPWAVVADVDSYALVDSWGYAIIRGPGTGVPPMRMLMVLAQMANTAHDALRLAHVGRSAVLFARQVQELESGSERPFGTGRTLREAVTAFEEAWAPVGRHGDLRTPGRLEGLAQLGDDDNEHLMDLAVGLVEDVITAVNGAWAGLEIGDELSIDDEAFDAVTPAVKETLRKLLLKRTRLDVAGWRDLQALLSGEPINEARWPEGAAPAAPYGWALRRIAELQAGPTVPAVVAAILNSAGSHSAASWRAAARGLCGAGFEDALRAAGPLLREGDRSHVERIIEESAAERHRG